MKKALYLLLAVSFLLSSCASTERVPVRLGFNYNDVVGKEVESWCGSTGFHLGGGIGFLLCDSWTLQPEVLFSKQGSDYKEVYSEGEFTEEFSGTYTLNYLNVPVMAQYEVFDGFALEAGPQVGFLLSANEDEDGIGEEDITDEVKGVDFGAVVGANYTFNNGINVGARYNLGLTDFNDRADFGDVKWKNSVIMLTVAYYIKLGKIKGESNDDD